MCIRDRPTIHKNNNKNNNNNNNNNNSLVAELQHNEFGVLNTKNSALSCRNCVINVQEDIIKEEDADSIPSNTSNTEFIMIETSPKKTISNTKTVTIKTKRRSKSLGVNHQPRFNDNDLPPRRDRSQTTAACGVIETKRKNCNLPPVRPTSATILNWQKQHHKSRQKYLSCLLCLLFTISYIGCMLPVCIHLAGVLTGAWCSSARAFRVFTLLPLVNSLLNPLFYFFKRKDFRKHIRRIGRSIRRKRFHR